MKVHHVGSGINTEEVDMVLFIFKEKGLHLIDSCMNITMVQFKKDW